MSTKALFWAIERTVCPSSSTKLVLITLANFANERDESWCSLRTIARISGLNLKTVAPALDALEHVGLIEKTGRHGGDNARVPVYRLQIEMAPKTGTAPDEGPQTHAPRPRKPVNAPSRSLCPKTGAPIVPVISGSRTRNRAHEPLLEPLSPKDADASLPPDPGSGQAADADGEGDPAPPIDSLPPAANAVARQWPGGAYAAQWEAWRGDPGASRRARRNGGDPRRAWASHVVRLGAQPLRDAKAGLRLVAAPIVAPLPPRPAVDHGDEDPRSGPVREALRRRLGAAAYDRWLDGTRIEIDDRRVTVRAGSPFAADYIRQHHQADIAGACAGTLGRLAIEVEADRIPV